MAAFYTFINRAIHICSDSHSFKFEIQYLKGIAINRGFNHSIIDNAFLKLQHPRSSSLLQSFSLSNISLYYLTFLNPAFSLLIFLGNMILKYLLSINSKIQMSYLTHRISIALIVSVGLPILNNTNVV